MSHPSSLNSLMKHLRDSGVEIAGSSQKRKLKNIGYYHGYKGYRFAGTAANRLPITDFNHVVLLHDFDTRIKTLVFPCMMNIETALKNYTLEAVLADAGSSNFDDIWRKSLTGYRCCGRNRYKDEWGRRQNCGKKSMASSLETIRQKMSSGTLVMRIGTFLSGQFSRL